MSFEICGLVALCRLASFDGGSMRGTIVCGAFHYERVTAAFSSTAATDTAAGTGWKTASRFFSASSSADSSSIGFLMGTDGCFGESI